MKSWQREARMAGRWHYRASYVGDWARRYCLNKAQICENTARAMAWLSCFR